MFSDGHEVDGSWVLRVYVTDLQVERSLRVKGDLHIGGVMLRLVEDLGEWGDYLNVKIRNQERLSCAFQFKGNTIKIDRSSGTAPGRCRCGGSITCHFERTANNIVEIRCNATKGTGRCGKRHLAGSKRQDLAEQLRGKSVYALRSEMANELIEDDEDDEDSPFLYTSGVMRTAKWQDGVKNHIHQDPWIALHLLNLQKMPHEIQYYCAAPFFIQWCTKHQKTIYTKMMEKEHVCLAIDASGRFVRQLPLPDKSTTGPIYLYSIVAKSSIGQVAIAQMLSARHTTMVIQFWLLAFREHGALPIPKEIVTDGSRALLGACVGAFTRQRTVIEYADQFFNEPLTTLPSCYIRLDVAHFLKKYRDLLNQLGRNIKQFYLASLGKLIRCENRQEAERIIRALLTISQCETDGPQSNGEKSAIQEEKEFLERLLTDEDYEFESLEESNLVEREGTPESQGEEIEKNDKTQIESSKWHSWATKENSIVLRKIKENPGKPRNANAHVFPKFAERLIDDLKDFPLWSCITRHYFGYGRNPASSSHVEGEFKNIRHLLLPSYNLKPPIRVDDFLQVYSSHVNGLSKIKRVEIQKTNINGDGDVIGSDNEELNDFQNEESPREFRDQLHTETIDEGLNTANNEGFNYHCNRESNQEFRDFFNAESHSSSGTSEDDTRVYLHCRSCGKIVKGPYRCAICDMAIHNDASCSVPLDDDQSSSLKICQICKFTQEKSPENFQTAENPISSKNNEKPQVFETNSNEPEVMNANEINDAFFHGTPEINRAHVPAEQDLDDNNSSNQVPTTGSSVFLFPQHSSSPIEPTIRKKIRNKRKFIDSSDQTVENEQVIDLSISSQKLRNLDSHFHDHVTINQADGVCCTCGEKTEELQKCGFCHQIIHPKGSCSMLFRVENEVEGVRLCLECKSLFDAAQYFNGNSDPNLSLSQLHNVNKSPVKISDDEIIHPEATSCPVCKRDVGLAHKCKHCQLPVHAIDTCSIPDAEADEEFGQLRICLNCQQKHTSNTNNVKQAESHFKCVTCGKTGTNMSVCLICGFLIHTVNSCSVPCNVDDRGTPQNYICHKCSSDEDIAQIVQLRSLENWKGEAQKFQQKEIRGWYLGHKYPRKTFAETKKLATIPILKSGANPELKAVILNGNRIDLINTCAFDSASQLFLSALYDSDDFCSVFQRLISNNTNLFMQMSLQVRKSGVGKETYKNRARILEPISARELERVNCITLDAAITIGGLCRHVFRNISCFKEVSKCNTCNFHREKQFPITSVMIETLKKINYNEWIENEITVSQNRICSDYRQENDGCVGRISNDLKISDIAMDWSDHALWWSERNHWLTRTRSTLDQYGVAADALLHFTPMHKTLRVQLPDMRCLDCRVDFSVKTFNAVINLCKELGIRHPEELSFCKPLEPNHLKYNLKDLPAKKKIDSQKNGHWNVPADTNTFIPVTQSPKGSNGSLDQSSPFMCAPVTPNNRNHSTPISSPVTHSGTWKRNNNSSGFGSTGSFNANNSTMSLDALNGGLSESLAQSPTSVSPDIRSKLIRPKSLIERARMNVAWLDSSLSIMEQGIREFDTLRLKFKFYSFYDLNPKTDSVRINMIYEQAKWQLLAEEIDCTEEEMLMFAALQVQVNLQASVPQPSYDTNGSSSPAEDDIDAALTDLQVTLEGSSISNGSCNIMEVPELCDYLRFFKPKRFTLKAYKRYWFTCRDLQLRLYKSREESNSSELPAHVINLRGCEVTPDVNLAQGRYGIRLEVPSADGMTEMWIRCETEQQYAKWMAACRLAAKGRSLADSSYESEVNSITAFLQLQRPAPAPAINPNSLDIIPEDYVAPRFAKKLKGKLVQRILEAHTNVKDLPLIEAKLNYIKAWQSLPEYGISLFIVRFSPKTKDELLGIANNRLMRMDLHSGDHLKTWRYNTMKAWNVNWEVKHMMVQFEEENIIFETQSADCKVVHEFIGGYIFLSMRSKEANQTLNEEMFHKLTGGWV